ncbi:MAG: nucleotidyltransferase family protein [Bacteroidia bacterium]
MIKSAIILAGGFGTRLQSVVSDVPKPMAKINNRPFLEYLLDYLNYYEISNVILSVGYKAELIQNHFKSQYKNIQVEYALEDTPLGTGGGIRNAMKNISNSDDVFVLNGDSFFDINLNSFLDFHALNKSKASLSLRQVEDASRYGTIITDETSQIISFEEKNSNNTPGIINAGVYLLNKVFFEEKTKDKTNFSIEKDFFEKYISEKCFFGLKLEGYFIDIGIPEDYKRAQDEFKQFRY